jgi:hypothetical protein
MDLPAPMEIVGRRRHWRAGKDRGADSDIDERDDGGGFHRLQVPAEVCKREVTEAVTRRNRAHRLRRLAASK